MRNETASVQRSAGRFLTRLHHRPQTPALRKTANDPGIGSPKTRPHFIARSFSPEDKSSADQPLGRLTWNKIITHSGQQAIRVKWSLRAGCNTVAVPAVSWKCSAFLFFSSLSLSLSLFFAPQWSIIWQWIWAWTWVASCASSGTSCRSGCWTLNASCQVRLVPKQQSEFST